MTMVDSELMAKALQLAKKGIYSCAPNPRVGCVIVKDGRVVGEGWHQKTGGLHAEIVALQQAGNQAKQATVYLTLEPCRHYGNTPPCCEALVRAGVTRIVAAMEDPDERTSGKSFSFLRAHDIKVEVGLLEKDARWLNRGFIKRCQQGLPWVTCKLAMSIDGRTAVAKGQSQWISGINSRTRVQQLRAASCGIMCGVGTVKHDDPRLTLREKDMTAELKEALGIRRPVRLIMDSQLRTPSDSKVLESSAPTVLFCQEGVPIPKWLEADHIEVVALPVDEQSSAHQVSLTAALRWLSDQSYNEILCEGGATLAASALQEKVMDQLILFVAPKLLGQKGLPIFGIDVNQVPADPDFKFSAIETIDNDLMITLLPQYRSN